MAKETFTREQAVQGMAGLLLTIQELVKVIKNDNVTHSTEFITSLYDLTRSELSRILSDKLFADIGEMDGRVYFSPNTDQREMGAYDEQGKTFRWSSKGLRRVIALMSEIGRYPYDYVIRHFIDNEDPVKIITQSINK